MEALTDFLISHGELGMFIAALLGGSVVPFASEVVMLGLLAAGANPTALLVYATIGNTLGGLVNYGIGSLGKQEWITRYAKVSPERLEKGLAKVRKYGSWAGLLAWIPFFGSVVTVSLGYMRCRFLYSTFNIAVGKFVRYAIILSACAIRQKSLTFAAEKQNNNT